VILVAAVVVGAVAAVGLLNYVRNVESTAGQEASPVEMWVIRQPIAKGTSIDAALNAGMIGLSETAAKFRPATAVVDPASELAGLVAITDLPIDMPVLTGSWVSPRVIDTGITDRLEERGLVTVTFNVDQAKGAAYLIEPGDYVNVLIERQWTTPFFEENPPVAMTATAVAELAAELEAQDSVRPILTDLYPVDSRYVYQKAEVLAIGNSLVPDIGDTEADVQGTDESVAGQGLVTLAVPPEAVQVILNVGRDNIYLSLVPDDYEPIPLPPLDPTTQVLPGERDGFLTPYAGLPGYGAPVDELLFDDPEDRIGVTPSGDSGEPTTGSSGSSSSGSSIQDGQNYDGAVPPTGTRGETGQDGDGDATDGNGTEGNNGEVGE
jgi:Flp pilus assembly protein CpaB